MRTFFEPEQREEFEAAQELMVRRFAVWAERQGLPVDPWVAEAAWDYRHADTPDGRLTLWSPVHVREFLLEWMPRRLTVQPGEELPDGPGTMAALLRYFDETGLRDPRGGTLAANQAALETASGQFRAAMADRELWGTAKFWATTAAEHGVDITDPHAMQRFSERAQRGQVPYDEALAGRIMQRRFADGPFVGRALPQLPVALPPLEELRDQAGRSVVVEQLRVFTAWVGPGGRKLTTTGRLQMADARELVGLLGTGDTVDPVHAGVRHRTRSSADLPEVHRLFEWARKARLVRTVKGRLVQVAKAAPLLADPLTLWQRAFGAVAELGEVLLGSRGGWAPAPSMLYDVYEETLPDVLNTLYSLPEPMPWPRLRDSVHLAYRSAYDLDGIDPRRRSVWLGHADTDLRKVLAVLEQLGVLERAQGMASEVFLADLNGQAPGGGPESFTGPGLFGSGNAPHAVPTAGGHDSFPPLPAGIPPELARLLAMPVHGPEVLVPEDAASQEQARALRAELSAGPVELIALTDLGTWAVRERLLGEGRDAPMVGELTQATAPELLGVLAEHYPVEAARQEVEAWTNAHGGWLKAFDRLLDAVRQTPFRIRAQDMLAVVCGILPEAEQHGLLHSLRDDPALGPSALTALIHQDLLNEEDLTEVEQQLVMTEAILSSMEISGRQAATDFLESLGLQEAQAALCAALDSGHPDHTGLDELRTLADQLQGRPLPRPTAQPGKQRAAPTDRHGKNSPRSSRKRRRG
ncbi:hypothetical protein [Streptomyces sp. NBC_01233]|uniref:hypothetical protein n=1 Tax=Streptomyces sp. NBC_01233 TaxID=2903787 RepID=UPI002E15D2F1|nr:hypothetical protein OG332_11415 [Streptomyces sp. NBC_01233]